MTEPLWVSIEDIEEIHRSAVEIGGGSHGLRDKALLESAIARPLNQFLYGVTDVFLLAAIYAESIAKNHPFIDGNKRAAFMTCDLFLFENGFALRPSDAYAPLMERLAQGLVSVEDFAAQLKRNADAL